MNLLFGHAKTIQAKIIGYLDIVRQVGDRFSTAMNQYFKDNDPQETAKQALETHKLESKADDLRREIEQMLYSKALLPEFRGDIYRLLEAMDHLPDMCEKILFKIDQERLKLPKPLLDNFRPLCETSLDVMISAIELGTALFNDPAKILELCKIIDNTESYSDSQEYATIKKIFSMAEIDDFQKILLKELVQMFGTIADEAKHVADVINIIHVKVRV